MSCLRNSFGAAVCLLAALPLMAEDAALPGYVPAGARLIVGLRVRSLVDALTEQGFGKEAQEQVAGLLAKTPLAGLDPLHDVDEILLTAAGEGQNPPALVVMTGRFNAAEFSSKGKPYRNALILESQPGSSQGMALVDANTILAGDLSLVRAAIDGGGKGEAIEAGLAARAAPLRARFDIWGAGDPPAGMKAPAGAEQLESIDHFEFGVRLTHGLECVAELHSRSPQDLEKTMASLQLLKAMMQAQTAGGSEGGFDLHTGNGSIYFSLSVPEEALKKAVAAQRASLVLAAAAQGAARATPPKPKAPAKTAYVRDAAGNTLIVTLPGRE